MSEKVSYQYTHRHPSREKEEKRKIRVEAEVDCTSIRVSSTERVVFNLFFGLCNYTYI